MNQKEEKWREELMDEFCVTFERAQDDTAVERLESFIKERFVYKPDLIALVEGKKESMSNKAMVQMGDLSFGNYTPTEIYNKALDNILATLKDTLSNKE